MREFPPEAESLAIELFRRNRVRHMEDRDRELEQLEPRLGRRHHNLSRRIREIRPAISKEDTSTGPELLARKDSRCCFTKLCRICDASSGPCPRSLSPKSSRPRGPWLPSQVILGLKHVLPANFSPLIGRGFRFCQ